MKIVVMETTPGVVKYLRGAAAHNGPPVWTDHRVQAMKMEDAHAEAAVEWLRGFHKHLPVRTEAL